MAKTYYFEFKAPKSKRPDELVTFLRSVEEEAKKMGFEPTMVLNAIFDTTERKQFSRRLTTGLLVEDERLKGANLADDGRFLHLDTVGGSCRLPPAHGVVLVITNEQGQETVFGFLRFPEKVTDVHGRIVAESGLCGAWYFRGFLTSPDPRYRSLVEMFAAVGYLHSELDEFKSLA